MTGLHVIKKPRKDGPRWYVYAWRGGPCIHSQDGPRPVIGPELLEKALAERKRGAPQDTISGLIKAYTASAEYTGLRPPTRRDYDYSLAKIDMEFGKARLKVFEDRRMRNDIINWRDNWRHQPRTADKVIVMLGILLGWGMLRGLVGINIAHGIPLIYKSDRSDLIWEERHWDAFKNKPQQLLDALELDSMTGLRLKDLVSVSWTDVTEKAIILTTSKRNGRAVVPIFPELRTWLDSRTHREGPLLRNSRGKGWTTSGLESVFQKHKPKGFDRTIHDIRGTYVTWLAVKGLTDEEIARIVGWTAKRVANIRARYVDEARVIISLIDRLSA